MNTPMVNEIQQALSVVAHAQAVLHDLSDKLRLPAIAEKLDRERHAAAYESTAGILRRRADKAEGADKADLARRADWYEQRAHVMRSGAIMPFSLRTPFERLSIVADVREQLVKLMRFIATQVEARDVPEFVHSLLPVDAAKPAAGPWTTAAEAFHLPEVGQDDERYGDATEEQLLGEFARFIERAMEVLWMLGAYTKSGQLFLQPFGVEIVSSPSEGEQ